jgi:hypothetical protein
MKINPLFQSTQLCILELIHVWWVGVGGGGEREKTEKSIGELGQGRKVQKAKGTGPQAQLQP